MGGIIKEGHNIIELHFKKQHSLSFNTFGVPMYMETGFWLYKERDFKNYFLKD